MKFDFRNYLDESARKNMRIHGEISNEEIKLFALKDMLLDIISISDEAKKLINKDLKIKD